MDFISVRSLIQLENHQDLFIFTKSQILLPVYMAACGLFLSSSWRWVPFFTGGTKIPEEREGNEWKRVEPVDMGEPKVFR